MCVRVQLEPPIVRKERAARRRGELLAGRSADMNAGALKRMAFTGRGGGGGGYGHHPQMINRSRAIRQRARLSRSLFGAVLSR